MGVVNLTYRSSWYKNTEHALRRSKCEIFEITSEQVNCAFCIVQRGLIEHELLKGIEEIHCEKDNLTLIFKKLNEMKLFSYPFSMFLYSANINRSSEVSSFFSCFFIPALYLLTDDCFACIFEQLPQRCSQHASELQIVSSDAPWFTVDRMLLQRLVGQLVRRVDVGYLLQ
ncbi:hypothetical protein T4B_15248 [Trichinella pseudospiralis]|uniref:Uncharacterized protein n=1 Tax=Trichinella pseudospiralis TaxID=6337 RepID=A0A0V1IEF3_TRIPS|nr:hypothetical protein T4B_15248 [Trichinella pseudospiralis]